MLLPEPLEYVAIWSTVPVSSFSVGTPVTTTASLKTTETETVFPALYAPDVGEAVTLVTVGATVSTAILS